VNEEEDGENTGSTSREMRGEVNEGSMADEREDARARERGLTENEDESAETHEDKENDRRRR